jgi:hypothetical protein
VASEGGVVETFNELSRISLAVSLCCVVPTAVVSILTASTGLSFTTLCCADASFVTFVVVSEGDVVEFNSVC